MKSSIPFGKSVFSAHKFLSFKDLCRFKGVSCLSNLVPETTVSRCLS